MRLAGPCPWRRGWRPGAGGRAPAAITLPGFGYLAVYRSSSADFANRRLDDDVLFLFHRGHGQSKRRQHTDRLPSGALRDRGADAARRVGCDLEMRRVRARHAGGSCSHHPGQRTEDQPVEPQGSMSAVCLHRVGRFPGPASGPGLARTPERRVRFAGIPIHVDGYGVRSWLGSQRGSPLPHRLDGDDDRGTCRLRRATGDCIPRAGCVGARP